MSYLDLPRLHFAGSFQAAPATVNNTPNNYPAGVPPEATELYWNPNGTSIFDLIGCKITALADARGLVTSADVDPLIGQTVVASYTKAPPKLVDLDPMQQNTSEIWGLLLQVGDPTNRTTGNVRGAYTEGPFNGIWVQATIPPSPGSSASGSAFYQSTLTNLAWQAPGSGFLHDLQARTGRRLSIRMVVRAHNNAPPTYDFSTAGLQKLIAGGVPANVVALLEPMSHLIQNIGSPPGIVPTNSYVNSLLVQYLGQQVAQANSATIFSIATIPYRTTDKEKANYPYDFCYGQVFGTIGPCADDEPTYMTPSRVLAPATVPAPGQGCFFAPAQLTGQRLTLDLGNSLPTFTPGSPPKAAVLGSLAIGWLDDAGTFTSLQSIDATTILPNQAGIVDVEVGVDVSKKRLCLANTATSPATPLLSENGNGYYLLADQFVFRMNPGIASTNAPARGDTATAEIYATKFGQPLPNTEVTLTMLSEDAAKTYTLGTLGTSNTRGIKEANLSVPTNGVTFEATATTDARGIARFHLAANNPGNPRGAVDGQIYFLCYQFASPPTPYVQGPDELISVQVYEQTTASGTVTWTNTIQAILGQYGALYPIMGNIGLSDYASVVRNSTMIKTVLSRSMLDPLHMPVTRDLSDSRRSLVLGWIAAGMPE